MLPRWLPQRPPELKRLCRLPAPELLDEVFSSGELRVGDKIVRRGRPPLGAQSKNSVTLRLDADVLEAYRALGRGWQTQVNADLRRARKLKKA